MGDGVARDRRNEGNVQANDEESSCLKTRGQAGSRHVPFDRWTRDNGYYHASVSTSGGPPARPAGVPAWDEAAEDGLAAKRVGRPEDDAGHSDRARRADLADGPRPSTPSKGAAN
jgi:hypothetical protein